MSTMEPDEGAEQGDERFDDDGAEEVEEREGDDRESAPGRPVWQ
jgi:hypothetical protein